MANQSPEPLWTAAERFTMRKDAEAMYGDHFMSVRANRILDADRTVSALIEALAEGKGVAQYILDSGSGQALPLSVRNKLAAFEMTAENLLDRLR